jgi:hypothetical protein
MSRMRELHAIENKQGRASNGGVSEASMGL